MLTSLSCHIWCSGLTLLNAAWRSGLIKWKLCAVRPTSTFISVHCCFWRSLVIIVKWVIVPQTDTTVKVAQFIRARVKCCWGGWRGEEYRLSFPWQNGLILPRVCFWCTSVVFLSLLRLLKCPFPNLSGHISQWDVIFWQEKQTKNQRLIFQTLC